MCVKCRYKALILARKSVQPFIINSHLNSFSFRLLLFFFFFLPMCRVYSETEKSVRRIKRSLGWREFVWWVMRWTNSKKKKVGRKIHLPGIILVASWGPRRRFFFFFLFSLRHSLCGCRLLALNAVCLHKTRSVQQTCRREDRFFFLNL